MKLKTKKCADYNKEKERVKAKQQDKNNSRKTTTLIRRRLKTKNAITRMIATMCWQNKNPLFDIKKGKKEKKIGAFKTSE